MLKKYIRIGAGLLLLTASSQIHAQLVDLPYNYGTNEYLKAEKLYDNELIRKAEFRLMKMVKDYPDALSQDKSVLLQADIDLLSNNYVIAVNKLTAFIKERSNSPFVPFAEIQRAYIEFEQKNYKQADIYFQSTLVSAENNYNSRNEVIYRELAHNAVYWRAVALSQQGKYQDAEQVFETAVSKYPNGEYADDAQYSLAAISEINRDYSSAVKRYRLTHNNYEYSNVYIASYIREANNLIILRDYSSAVLALERAESVLAKIASEDSVGNLYEKQSYCENADENISYLKGEAYNLAGNFKSSLEIFSSFISKYLNSVLVNNARLGAGWAHLNLNEYDKALSYYDYIILNEPADSKTKATAQLYRAVALKRSGNVTTAKKELAGLSMLSSYPFLGTALLELGQIHYELKEYEQAKRALERADRESMDAKSAVRIHLLLGASLMELKAWDKAVSEYNNAEQLAQNSNETYIPQKKWYLAESRLKQGICLVLGLRSAEAVQPLLAFIGDNKNDPRTDEAMFWLAEAYYRSEALKNSTDIYSRIIKDYPSSTRREEALYGLGWSNFRLKDFDKSSKIFDQMVKEFPKSKYGVEVLSRQGDGYYLIKNYSQAADAYRKAFKLSPQSDEGQYSAYQLTHALYRMGKYEQSITSLLDFVRTYPKSPFAPNALYLIGWIRFQQGKYAESIDNFQFLISAYPQSSQTPRAYYAIADAYYNAGNYEEAIAGYKKLVETYPSSDLAPEAMKSVQYALQALGRENEAISIADTYIESNPNSPYIEDFKYKRAEMFYTGRRYQDAVSEYENFQTKYPDSEKNAEALYWMGKSYINLNEPSKAVECFIKLKNKFAKSEYAPVALLEWGLLEKQLNLPSKADSVFSLLEFKYPEHESAAQAGFERAVMKFSMGDTLGSMSKYLQVAEKYPTMDYGDQSRYRVGMYYRSVGKFDTARQQFEILSKVEENPNIAAEAQYRIGELWMREDSLNNAVSAFEIVKEKFPGFEDWYSLSLLNLGEAYEKLSIFDKAKEVYNTLYAIRPEDEFGRTAKSRLKRIK